MTSTVNCDDRKKCSSIENTSSRFDSENVSKFSYKTRLEFRMALWHIPTFNVTL